MKGFMMRTNVLRLRLERSLEVEGHLGLHGASCQPERGNLSGTIKHASVTITPVSTSALVALWAFARLPYSGFARKSRKNQGRERKKERKKSPKLHDDEVALEDLGIELTNAKPDPNPTDSASAANKVPSQRLHSSPRKLTGTSLAFLFSTKQTD